MMSHRFNLLAVMAVLLAVSGEAKQLRTRELVDAEEVSKPSSTKVQFVVTSNNYGRNIYLRMRMRKKMRGHASFIYEHSPRG